MRNVACLVCCAILFPSSLNAQGTTASIVGTVYDPSGAIIPGVEVNVTHTGTGVVRTALSNSEGRYVLRNLQIGRYTVTAELPGFKKAEMTDITLLIDQTARIDLRLETGEISDVVTVDGAELPLLNKVTSDVGQVIENRRIVELPLNEREFLTLARLSPGVTGPPPGALGTFLQGEWASINASGLRSEMQMVTINGIIDVEPQNNSLSARPSVDAIQEFKIQTSNFSAELPSKGGAVVNVAIKSGTNDFHGSLFAFNRNSATSARSFFEGRNRPVLNQNQFGGTIGGPILRDKTFFFFAYEGRTLRRPEALIGTVPTAEQRRGVFDPKLFGPIYDPATWDPAKLTRQPFANNTIPADRISNVSRKVLDFISLPTAPGISNNISKAVSFRDDLNIWNFRVDHHFGERDTLRFNFNINDQERLAISGFGEGVGGVFRILDRSHWNGAYVHIFSPVLTNEFRFGLVRHNHHQFGRNRGTNFAHDIFGIPGSEPRPEFSDFPSFSLAGYNFPSENNVAVRPNTVYQAGNHLTWVRGNHSLKFGADAFLSLNFDLTCLCSGAFTFSGQYVSAGRAAPNNDAFAQFLLGHPNVMNRQETRDKSYYYGRSYGIYFQDDWRVSTRLTLNFGLRQDYAGPIREKNDRSGTWDFATGQLVYPQGARLEDCDPVTGRCSPFVPAFPFRLHNSRSLYDTEHNWGPRLGFAYELRPNLVFRMAYGIFNNTHLLTRTELLTGFNVPWKFTPQIITHPEIPNASLDRGFAGSGFSKVASPLIRAARPMEGFRNAVAQMWNLGFQLGLSTDLMLDVAYVGSKGSHGAGRLRTNIPPPGAGPVQARRPFPLVGLVEIFVSGQNSHYHSLQTKLNKRFTKGAALNLAYTLSKSIDNASSDANIGGGDAGDLIENPFLMRESTRGLSSFDLPHRFVASYIWEIPGRPEGFLRHVLAGWQVSGIGTIQSGWPFTVDAPSRTNNDTGSRADRTCDGALGTPTVQKWFDTACFAQPAVFTYGNSGRNIVRTDGLVNFDVNLAKTWPLPMLGEQGRLQFRAEMFNLFNHPTFGLPIRNLASRTVGQVTTASLGREIQFGLKLLF